MKKNTFKVAFIIRRNQVNKDGKCAIMIRITVDENMSVSTPPFLYNRSYGMRRHPRPSAGPLKLPSSTNVLRIYATFSKNTTTTFSTVTDT